LPEREELKSPLQLVCEGAADEVFFRRLLLTRQLAGIDVSCPKGKDGRCIGKSGFKGRLDAIQGLMKGTLRGVLLVTDADTNPGVAFTDAVACLSGTGKYPIPGSVYEIAQGAGMPSTAVAVIPAINRTGHLDSLILDCMEDMYRNTLIPCVDAFAQCANVEQWDESKRSKMRLRSLIAITYDKNPGLSLAYFLEEKNCPFDFNHRAFDSIATFIDRFSREA